MRKLIFVILDGMADDPHGKLLQKCNAPSLNEMCRNGSIGTVNVLPDASKLPQSDEAIFSLFGLDTSKGYPGRGPVEALGCGCISMGEKNYLASRVNFETVENKDSIWDARIIDRRAGRTLTTKEAKILGRALEKEIDIGCDFI
ncbi:MAG: phosphoglycerate mutase, partial [Candidatus Aenigmarchaeota archaeon]|nr:phosphoglycerate mutase [Candidatus Aenigmarchaeota archaeon]MDI6722398.1 phosphoglycerate mutase [Candidatus Aenigmarchaeota archaeon]